jgi:hypothetical protein
MNEIPEDAKSGVSAFFWMKLNSIDVGTLHG